MGHFQQHTYFNSYYYSSIISNIISREDSSVLGFISNFFNDNDSVFCLISCFEKYSAFHKFIQHIVYEFFEEDMISYDESVHRYHTLDGKPIDMLYAEIAFKNFGMEYDFTNLVETRKNITYQMIEDYHDELRISGYLEELYERIAKEVFYILFNNRKALLQFNIIASDYVQGIVKADIEDVAYSRYLKKDGVLKRASIPKWCQKAVFFRDRGRCCICGKDLSGLISTESIKHFDHIVPLALGGLNDVANIQLLCSECNLNKNKRHIITSNFYEFWY